MEQYPEELLAGGALGCLWLSRGLLVLGNVGHGSLLAGVAACARNLHGVSPKMLQEAWAPQVNTGYCLTKFPGPRLALTLSGSVEGTLGSSHGEHLVLNGPQTSGFSAESPVSPLIPRLPRI